MTNFKFILIIAASLISSTCFGAIYTYEGTDGDGKACTFSYDLKKQKGYLVLGDLGFRPIKMKYEELYLENYTRVLAGHVPHSDYFLIAESSINDNLDDLLSTLAIVTVIETHEDHAHVWFCFNLKDSPLRNKVNFE